MPMRVIAKKRCRAMFEPPEKGERATLNPNLSTRLNLLFSDQALGRGLAIFIRVNFTMPDLCPQLSSDMLVSY
jgi:hypothetical protein